MNPNEIELKPCPFCGGKAKIVTWRDEKRRENPTKIKCVSCGCTSGVKNRIGKAAAAWNRRVNDGSQYRLRPPL